MPACAPFPGGVTVAHARENRAALDLRLREIDMIKLEEAFPAPLTPQPLDML